MTVFHSLNRKLIDDGKIKQYFLYSLREILIVVIGILFALQVNNWNETRKERIYERKVLSEMLVGIDQNIGFLEMGLKRNKNAIASCQIILDRFDSGDAYNDSLDRHFQQQYPCFTPPLIIMSMKA